MKTIQQMWEDKSWPIRNGIYFADDTVAVLKILMPWENSEEAVSVSVAGSATLEQAEELRENKETHLAQLCEQANVGLDLRVVGGEGSHGSEGFIAVIELSTRHLVWLAYFDCSNPFEKVSLENGIVTAISNLRHAWHLPLTEPATLTVNTSAK